jgi:hypothetical protein
VIVDLIIVGLMVAVAVWGYSQGVSVGVLIFLGFGGGAVIGFRVAPLVLDGGLRDPFAPVIAVPAALLFGGVLALPWSGWGASCGGPCGGTAAWTLP